ncbi:hypothetical protein LA080_011998 [Diaporthe eres]|uniref:Uncharacterized protein n=1 Tax=Diaporthe vaccinii TaxID=105482 RepID=A0ABR4DT47_9PEZI|nr:hypothetical protein LA080_011998 [Diaporthe eres]
MIEFLDAFRAIHLRDSRLQMLQCWCYEAGLTRFHNSITALAKWMESAEDGIAALYLLPTTRDAEFAIAHLEADSGLAPLVSSTSPEAKRVLVKSFQQCGSKRLIGKMLALQDLVILVDLGAGVTSSYVSAMAATLFTELHPRNLSPLRTFSIVVLQEMTVDNTIGNYIFDHELVSLAVQHKGWQVTFGNAKTGSHPELKSHAMVPGCTFSDAGFEKAQIENSRDVLQEWYQQAVADGRADKAYKAVVLMSRPRFERLMGSVKFAKARSFFIHDGTPANLVQAICEDEEPGLAVVGIATEACILPRVKGMRLVIVDSTADGPVFDIEVGHAIAREKDATFMRAVQFLDIVHGAADLDLWILWDSSEHRPEVPVLFPFHHTDEMFHLIIRLADICPGHRLEEVPCLPLPREMPVLFERVRRLRLWGILEHTGSDASLAVTLTEGKGRLVSELAQHESNIHSLLLLAGAADPHPALPAQARHLLVWLAVVIAHDPRSILAHLKDLHHGSPPGGPTSAMAQRGSVWSAFQGVRHFSRRNDGNETKGPQAHAVEGAEAQQVLDRVAFWVGKLSLPVVSPETTAPEDVAGRDKALVERQLVCAFIFNIAIFDKVATKLADLLSGTELCLGDDARANLVAAGQTSQAQVVYAVYTDLHSSARGISPRNLTIVPGSAVYAELAKIAPRRHALPGPSRIDLAILRTRTARPVAPQQAPAGSSSAQVDVVDGEVEARVLD